MKREQMESIAKQTEALLHQMRPEASDVRINYEAPTEYTIARFDDFARQYHRIVPGDEYFILSEMTPEKTALVLYAVNVTADAPLTAAAELMATIARKF